MSYHDRHFTKQEIIDCFKVFENEKTFGQIDVNDVFHTQVPAKGIAGCIIEQSVLFMKQNSTQEADLVILQEDGKYRYTELKVTGVEPTNEDGKKYKAKEPLSITAVSIGKIENEIFDKSHFYNKVANMLWVFYVYDRKHGQKVVPYDEYSRFPILGYKFIDVEADEEELARFMNDWTITQEYIINANQAEDPEELYPMLHQSIKDRLFYIDIAPRYKKSPKQTPRFRFKKSYVDTIFQDFYNEKKKNKNKILERLPESFKSFSEIEEKLHGLTDIYRGKTVDELLDTFCIQMKDRNKLPKSITETIVVNMLRGKSKKISDIELFEKIGVIAKTITITKAEMRTEDIKFFTIDLNEITNTNLAFEDSSFYYYFREHKMLCIVFEEPSTKATLNENIFLGFKWFTFSEELIETTAREVYGIVCDKINNNTLEESYVTTKEGKIRYNKTGEPMVALNFPKSSEYNIFIRGTSSDSTHKPWELKGKAVDGTDTIHTYTQQAWMNGKYLVKKLKCTDFI